MEVPSDSEELGHAKVSSCVGDFGNLLWDCCAVWETGAGEEGLNVENAGNVEGSGSVRGERGSPKA